MSDRTWTAYCTGPIDWMWPALMTVEVAETIVARSGEEFDDEPTPRIPFTRSEAAEAFRLDLETAKALASRVFWEGDIVGGRIGVFWIPDPDNMTFEYAFAWKQVNNGSTFIVSPIPLPWLERLALGLTTT